MGVRKSWLPMIAGAGALALAWSAEAQTPAGHPSGAVSWQAKLVGWAQTATAALPTVDQGMAWLARTEAEATAASERALTWVKSYGPSFPMAEPSPDSPAAASGINDTEKQSIGCILGGTGGLAAAVGAGGGNVINLIAGGVVSAANPAATYLALGGVVFASFCAVGQALTPAALMVWDRLSNGDVGSAQSPQMNPGLPGRRPYWPIGPDGNWDRSLGYVVEVGARGVGIHEVGGRDGERLLILTGGRDSR
jgi:hypothetical protein